MEEQSTETQQHSPRPFVPAAVFGVLITMAAILLPATPAAANDSGSAPGAPIDLAVAPGNARLVVGWNPPQGDANVTAYTVQYKTGVAPDKAGDYDDPATGWVDVPYYGTETDTEINGLTNDAGYDVRVRASNDAGDGQWSDTASASPHEDIVWSAILTVDVDDTFSDSQTHGCADSSISTAKVAECRTALTEDEFTFDGGTYRWTSLYEALAPWHHAVMGFDANVPTDSGLRTGTLQIGDKTIYLGETDEAILRWLEDGDGWVVPQAEAGDPVFFPTKGQRLPMSLKARIPSESDGADQNGDADQNDSVGQTDDGDDQNDGTDQNGDADQNGDDQNDDADQNGDDDQNDDGDQNGDPQAQAQTAEEKALIEECRSYTRGLEGLRVCKPPFEGRDAVLMLTLASSAPAGGTTVTLATSPTQTASSDDYTMPSTITIGRGEVSGLITIAITADGVDEDHETILIYACVRDGCDPLEDWDYNHGITIPGTRTGGL